MCVRVGPPPVDARGNVLNLAHRQPNVASGDLAVAKVEVVMVRCQRVEVRGVWRVTETADLQHRGALSERDDVAVRGDEASVRSVYSDGAGHSHFFGRGGWQHVSDDLSPFEVTEFAGFKVQVAGEKGVELRLEGRHRLAAG